MIKLYIRLTRRDVLIALLLGLLCAVGYAIYRNAFVDTEAEIVDELSGNIFPSAILALATTDEVVVQPSDSNYVGNPKSYFGLRLRSQGEQTRVRIEVAETPFSEHAVSEFVLPKRFTTYTVYPDMVWKYAALRQNAQATPLNIVTTVSINGKAPVQRMRTFSMRSINECLTGYQTNTPKGRRFVNTRLLFAAYVNEDNPNIDRFLREALNTRIVNRFLGYQADSAGVVRQVYALWHVLQQRKFKYSSVTTTSLSSNAVYAQRIRTFDDALASTQINCVDGSALMASLLRAIDIDPILVRLPQHVFVGFYTDRQHRYAQFLETTMVGNINIEDYFPDEAALTDSTLIHKTRGAHSYNSFERARHYANAKFSADSVKIMSNATGYMYLEITGAVRRKVQPIGR